MTTSNFGQSIINKIIIEATQSINEYKRTDLML